MSQSGWGFSSQPDVAALSAVLMNATTGEILYSKDSQLRLPPASTTKVLTALVALERLDLNDRVMVSEQAASAPPSRIGLRAGEAALTQDLLYGLMLKSGNDAAETLAEAAGGSVAGFADLMNARAWQIGARNSHFMNPHGLPDDEHYSTAYDLALIFRQAINHPVFADIVRTRNADLRIESNQGMYGDWRMVPVVNHNRLLSSYEGTLGGKTGFTLKARRCFVGEVERDGVRLIVSILNSPSSGTLWRDARALLDYGFSHYGLASPPPMPAEPLPLLVRRELDEEEGDLNLEPSPVATRGARSRPVFATEIRPESRALASRSRESSTTLNPVAPARSPSFATEIRPESRAVEAPSLEPTPVVTQVAQARSPSFATEIRPGSRSFQARSVSVPVETPPLAETSPATPSPESRSEPRVVEARPAVPADALRPFAAPESAPVTRVAEVRTAPPATGTITTASGLPEITFVTRVTDDASPPSPSSVELSDPNWSRDSEVVASEDADRPAKTKVVAQARKINKVARAEVKPVAPPAVKPVLAPKAPPAVVAVVKPATKSLPVVSTKSSALAAMAKPVSKLAPVEKPLLVAMVKPAGKTPTAMTSKPLTGAMAKLDAPAAKSTKGAKLPAEVTAKPVATPAGRLGTTARLTAEAALKTPAAPLAKTNASVKATAGAKTAKPSELAALGSLKPASTATGKTANSTPNGAAKTPAKGSTGTAAKAVEKREAAKVASRVEPMAKPQKPKR